MKKPDYFQDNFSEYFLFYFLENPKEDSRKNPVGIPERTSEYEFTVP